MRHSLAPLQKPSKLTGDVRWVCQNLILALEGIVLKNFSFSLFFLNLFFEAIFEIFVDAVLQLLHFFRFKWISLLILEL